MRMERVDGEIEGPKEENEEAIESKKSKGKIR